MRWTAKDVTVYVPAYRAGHVLEGCLDALQRLERTPAEVIVIDDGSPAPVSAACRVIRHDVNRGLAAARNTALVACQTSLIASVDADVKVEPDWLERLLPALGDARVAGVGGALYEAFRETPGDAWRACHMAQHWGDVPVVNPRFLYGANTLMRVSALREVGGYDERLHTNNEDRTISEALYRQGYHLCYEPEARAWHQRRDDVVSVLRGYWNWHRPTGEARGDFANPEGLVRRIEDVIFGIFRYRAGLDQSTGASVRFAIDGLLPWVFATEDLRYVASRSGWAVPRLPWDAAPAWIQGIASVLGDAATGDADWHVDYEQVFREQLAQADSVFRMADLEAVELIVGDVTDSSD